MCLYRLYVEKGKNRKIERFYVNKIINILGLGKQRGGRWWGGGEI